MRPLQFDYDVDQVFNFQARAPKNPDAIEANGLLGAFENSIPVSDGIPQDLVPSKRAARADGLFGAFENTVPAPIYAGIPQDLVPS
jgi:hypothetical protein